MARGTQDLQVHPLSQARVIASSSDNLFHPVPDPPSSYAYIPSNPRLHTYNPPNIFQHPLPYHSPFTSYNNPNIAVPPHPALPPHPPLPPHPTLPPCPPLVQRSPISPTRPFVPPFPPCVNSQPHFDPSQHAYNHFQPAYTHQPEYDSQPASHHFPPVYNNHPPYIPPVQPFYQLPALPPVSPRSTSPVSSTSLKNLPTVTHIPILNLKQDFFAWDEGVTSLIHANSLLGHILNPSSYVDPIRPDLAPNPLRLPVLSMTSSPQEIEVSNWWWAEDNIIQHILVSCLGSVPQALLPASNITTRT